MKKLLSALALVFAFGAKISAQSDDIDNSTATYAYIKDVKIW